MWKCVLPCIPTTATLGVNIRVIILADVSDSDQGLGVLVGGVAGIKEVEGRRVRWLQVAGCEVHTHSEVDLTTSHHKVQEGVQLSHLTKMEGVRGGGWRG